MNVRTLILSLALTASLTPALAPLPAAAQQAPAAAMPPCSGTASIIRVSEIKPGMMDTFLKAAAAQQAWYKKAVTPDEIYVMRVMVQNPETKAWSYSETEALTNHTMPGGPAAAPRDAQFQAFTDLFAASSTIKSTYLNCSSKM